MAENQTSTNSEGFCEKIQKAIRRVSDCPLSSKPTSSHPSSLLPSPDQKHQKKAANEAISTQVPIDFNSLVSPTQSKERDNTPVRKNGRVEKVALRNEQVKTRVAPRNEIAPPVRVAEVEKAKPMAVVGLGQGKGQLDYVKEEGLPSKGEKGNDNDKFSSYINRAKAKFRSTSGIGGGGNGGGNGGGGGGGGGGKSMARRDSLNEKVSNYINRTKIKFRSTSNVGGGRSVAIK